MIIFIITTVSVVCSSSDLNSHECSTATQEKIDIVYTWVNGSDPDFLRGDVERLTDGDLTRD